MYCRGSIVLFALGLFATTTAHATYTWVVNVDNGSSGSPAYSGQGALAAPGSYWAQGLHEAWYEPKDSLGDPTGVRMNQTVQGFGNWSNLGGTNNSLNQDGFYRAGTTAEPLLSHILLPDATASDRYDVAAYIGIPGYAAQTYTFSIGSSEATATTVPGVGGATFVPNQNYAVLRNVSPAWANAGTFSFEPTYAGYYLTLATTDNNASANSHLAGIQVAHVASSQRQYEWVVSADLGNADDAAASIYSGQAALPAPGDYWNNWFQMAAVSAQTERTGAPKDSLGNATDVRGYGYAAGYGNWEGLGGTNNPMNQDGLYSAGTENDYTTWIITLGPDAKASDRYDVAAYVAIPGYAEQTYTFTLGAFDEVSALTETVTTVAGMGGATFLDGQNYVVFRDVAPLWADPGDLAIGSESALPYTYEGYYLKLVPRDNRPDINAHFAGFQIAKVVPEPSSLLLLGMAVLGLLVCDRRKRR